MSWHHGDYLSLAQAIAATLAIFGAFGVVFVQRHFEVAKQRQADQREELARREKTRDVVQVARLVVDHLLVTLEEIREVVGAAITLATDIGLEQRINEHVAQIRQIPLYGLPTHVALALLRIDLACTNIRTVVVARARPSVGTGGLGMYIHAMDEQMTVIKNRSTELVIEWSD